MHNYTIQKRPTFFLIGIQCRTINTVDRAPHDISNLWKKFYNEGIYKKIPNKVSNEVIALYCDYEKDHTEPYSLVIGSVVSSLDEVPHGMVGKSIPSSTYALFSAVGEYPNSVVETWREIWNTALKRTYTGDLEIYTEDFYNNSPKAVDILIAIEK